MARDLRLGLNIGYWAGGPPAGAQETIAEAEQLGFDSMWTAEAYGSDVLTPLAWWGARTERIKLGTAIAQISARAPAATAMAAPSSLLVSTWWWRVIMSRCFGFISRRTLRDPDWLHSGAPDRRVIGSAALSR